VLELFEAELRDELVLRVALLDQINPSALVELNDMLERTLGDDTTAEISGIGGARPAAEILRLFTGGLEKTTLASIRQHSEKLAEQIFERMFTFEDLMKIAPQAVQTLLTEVPDDAIWWCSKAPAPICKSFSSPTSPKARPIVSAWKWKACRLFGCKKFRPSSWKLFKLHVRCKTKNAFLWPSSACWAWG
jgi:flagellar motor switch protein FliG